MKKIALILIVLIGFVACKSNTASEQKTKTDTDGKAKFEFVEEVHDFGNVVQGEKVSYTFKFKNVGDADLIINSAKASCGCTVPEYDKEPIPPSGEGKIIVTFDSSNREGSQYKKVTINANSDPEIHELVITCNVVKP